jgi:tRNA pseudouridine38-40 synthase
MNVKLIISYDGTRYSGWQNQDDVLTVQGEIERCLEKIEKRYTPIYGAGRTDAGVHALAQCANFLSHIENIKARNFMSALNGLLPRDIRIMSASEAAPDFHARHSAKMRSYRYHIICAREANAFELPYSLQLWRMPSIERLNSYARLLHGETDCSIFASSKDGIFMRGSGSKFRYIQNAHFFYEGGKLVFEIAANAFFRKMVRSIIGTLLYYEEKNFDAHLFKEILAEGKRENAGPTALPQGLFLWRIDY